jgi:predicted flap endonuclease-1-like 5' DNA nuclease
MISAAPGGGLEARRIAVRAAFRLARLVIALAAVVASVSRLLRRRRAALDARPIELARPVEPAPLGEPTPLFEPAPPAESVDEVGEAPSVETVGADGSVDEVGDDLRLIRGIGPSIEASLRDLGIRTYRQLAEPTPAESERIRAALPAFPQRMEREDWAGQARALHREKYGEPR